MSEYKGIKGFQVQTRTEDPTDGIAGDFYYNSTTGQFKTINSGGAPIGTWSSVASLNLARDSGAGVGTTTAAFFAGGNASGKKDETETWNGSAWTEGNNLNTAKSHIRGAGVTTSAVVAGGEAPSVTNAVEKYNGTSWTTSTNYPASRHTIGALGASNTAALFFGGSPTTAESFEFDGTNFTEGGDLNTGRQSAAGCGTQTAGMAMGGYSTAYVGVVEQYNGSAWTEVGDLNTSRAGLASSQQAAYTSAIVFGGNGGPPTPQRAVTESWDGTSWTEVADLGTARYDLGGSGTGTTSALAFAGGTPSVTAVAEEWAAAEFQIKSVTTS